MAYNSRHNQAWARGEDFARHKIQFSHAFASNQQRSLNTARLVLQAGRQSEVPIIIRPNLREKAVPPDWVGALKSDIEQLYDKALFKQLRRSWDEAPPGGETLKQVSERASPILDQEIIRLATEGKQVLSVVHNNVLLALGVHVGMIEKADIATFKFGNLGGFVLDVAPDGVIKSVELLKPLV